MSFWGSSTSSGVSPDATFVSLAEKTIYGSVLDVRMVFGIYVHRGGVSGNFHDRIVVVNVKYGFVTLELSKDHRDRVVPKCEQFQGSVSDLICMTEVECTFRELAEEAITILRNMGDYIVFGNNCQNFCNYFLEVMKAPQYKTTARAVGEGAATGTGIAVFGFIISLFFGAKR